MPLIRSLTVAVYLLASCGDPAASRTNEQLAPATPSDAGRGGDGAQPPDTGGDTLGAPSDALRTRDFDRDGLDDDWELSLARAYLPFLSLHPEDKCPLGGVIFRARPHPDDLTRIAIVYDHLFAEDCGLNGHPGDNETFGVTVNASLPPPAGIESIATVAHQGSPMCEDVAVCGGCDGLRPCTTKVYAGADWPVVLSGKDKHGTFLHLAGCLKGLCLDTCFVALEPTNVPLLNVGEPHAPLVTDLTLEGFVRPELGWEHASLLNINPWDPDTRFGGAGNIRDDLFDPNFVAPICP